MSGIQVGWGSQWETLANAINDWYGGGVSSAQYQQVVQMLNSGEYTMEQMEGILQQIPDFSTTYNAEGKLTQVSYKAVNAGNTAAGSIANAANSNAASATTTQFQTVQNVTTNAQTGKVAMSDTVTKYSSGTAGTAKAVAGSAIAAVTAAAVGISIGKIIDQAAYDLGFNWLSWAGVDIEALNPETWASITNDLDTPAATLFNWIFTTGDNTATPPTINPQGYIDEKTFAYMVAYMAACGVFDTGEETAYSDVFDIPVLKNNSFYYVTAPIPDTSGLVRINYEIAGGSTSQIAMYMGVNVRYEHAVYGLKNSETYPQHAGLYGIFTSKTPVAGAQSFTYDNKTVYYISTNADGSSYNCVGYDVTTNPYSVRDAFSSNARRLAWIIEYGTHAGGGGVEGITPQEGTTQFNATGLDPTDIDAILAALQTQFPDLWDNRIEVSPDGETVVNYIPVGFPTGGVGEYPTTNGATATDLSPDITGDGDNATDELIKTLIDMIQNPQSQSGMESDTDMPTEPIDPNMPNTGGGVTPPYVTPTGSASALYSVYNPSQTELNNLGAWLWSSNFVDQLLKLFNDPMQAIIGLHKIFTTPSTSGTGNIKVGYLDSGVSANLVNDQYTEIDCGTVKIDEYFKNALDYVKTDIYLYLPFIGIVPLNVEDVTRANVSVKYKVDVLTGACLATVDVTRDANGGGQLYAFAGNCAVQYPLSSGSYMGIVASALGIAGSVAGTILSGGAMLPMALGVGASALGGARTKVEHSGSLSGNAGAMGIKKPYLIIRRPQTKIADDFELMAGAINNVYDVLASFTGLTRVKYVHLENIPATSDELAEIETMLKSGVMI